MTTILAHQPDGHTTIAIDGFTTTTPNRALGYILTERLSNPPDGVDFVAWADHYVREIWPDEVRFVYTNGAADEVVPSELDPVHVVAAGIGLGLLTIPAGWDFGPWYPGGLHLYGPLDVPTGPEIVITGWDAEETYTVGLYDDLENDPDGGTFVDVRPDDLVDYLRDIFTLVVWAAPLAADLVMP